VNWAGANPAPLPGMVRTWTWEAFAHGAELVSYFRWRQLPYAQEQMHSGLNTPDGRLDTGGIEARQVAQELAALSGQVTRPAAVALVYDYASKWMIDITPHGAGFDYNALVFGFYRALRQLGLDVDIVSPQAELDRHALVVVPTLVAVEEGFVRRVGASRAQVVVGPRAGSKTAAFAVPEGLPPGPLAALLPLRVWRVESLRADAPEPVLAQGRRIGESTRWRDVVEPAEGVRCEARYADGHPAWLRHERFHCITGCFDIGLLKQVLQGAAGAAGIETTELPPDVRLRRRGDLQLAFNFGPQAVEAPAPSDARFALGERLLPPGGVAAWWR
jgi:beta-galactosidase